MLEKLSVRTFKSLDDVTVELGLVNVFIGANGSGKSNLLEAMGVLSAAADGKVDDQNLLSRGVRPGVPALYKSAFPARRGKRIPPHLSFEASNVHSSYSVTLHNPLKDPSPAWRYKTELWKDGAEILADRAPFLGQRLNPTRGMAASVDVTEGNALELLEVLQGYVIFSPATAVMRGVVPESQPKQPVGLSGGNLARAVLNLIKHSRKDEHSSRVCADLLELVDWAERIGLSRADRLQLSSSASAADIVIRFHDRFMRKGATPTLGFETLQAGTFPVTGRVLRQI